MCEDKLTQLSSSPSHFLFNKNLQRQIKSKRTRAGHEERETHDEQKGEGALGEGSIYRNVEGKCDGDETHECGRLRVSSDNEKYGTYAFDDTEGAHDWRRDEYVTVGAERKHEADGNTNDECRKRRKVKKFWKE